MIKHVLVLSVLFCTVVASAQLPVQVPGRFLFNGKAYSAGDTQIEVFDAFDPGLPLGVLDIQDYIYSLSFRKYSNGLNLVFVTSLDKVYIWDITDLNTARKIAELSTGLGFRWLPYGTIDQNTGMLYILRHDNYTYERKLHCFNINNPYAPVLMSTMAFPPSQSNRGGMVEIIGDIEGRRYMAVVISGQTTAILDVTSVVPVVVSTSLPYLMAMSYRGGYLFSHSGVEVYAYMSVWGNLNTSNPKLIAQKYIPDALWYDQTPNCRAIYRDGKYIIVGAYISGFSQDFLYVMIFNPLTNKVTIGEIIALVNAGGNMTAAVTDTIQSPVEAHAYIWGFNPYNDGWRYWLADINITDPTTAYIESMDEL